MSDAIGRVIDRRHKNKRLQAAEANNVNKRKATDDVKTTKKRKHKIVIGEELDDFGTTKENRDEQAIKAALLNADFVKFYADSDCVRIALASRRGEILNRDQAANEIRANEARLLAQEELKDILRIKPMPGNMVTEKCHVEYIFIITGESEDRGQEESN